MGSLTIAEVIVVEKQTCEYIETTRTTAGNIEKK